MGNRNKKMSLEEVEIFLDKLGFKLLSKYINVAEKVVLRDVEGYLYFVCLSGMVQGYMPKKFGKGNPYTIRNLKFWIQLNDTELKLVNLDSEIKDVVSKLTFKDDEGYLYSLNITQFLTYDSFARFHSKNPHTIHNIKLWCTLNNKPFELISEEFNGNDIKLIWQCLIDGCEEIFELNWGHISQHKGCAFCAGQKVGLSNCLATKNPELAKEWHPTKNGDLTPFDITMGSNIEIWWKCSRNHKHEWTALIRTRLASGCPYCSHRLATEEYNLLVINPELCEEWNYEKNIKPPQEYCPGSNQYAWWKCTKCGHEWEAIISSKRTINCEQCNMPRGENHHNWKGGITPEIYKVRQSKEYKQWRKGVFERDTFACVICGKQSKNNCAHHLESFADNEESRFDIDNGITLCREHHDFTVEGSFHNLYTNYHNTREQFEEYLKIVG